MEPKDLDQPQIVKRTPKTEVSPATQTREEILRQHNALLAQTILTHLQNRPKISLRNIGWNSAALTKLRAPISQKTRKEVSLLCPLNFTF